MLLLGIVLFVLALLTFYRLARVLAARRWRELLLLLPFMAVLAYGIYWMAVNID